MESMHKPRFCIIHFLILLDEPFVLFHFLNKAGESMSDMRVIPTARNISCILKYSICTSVTKIRMPSTPLRCAWFIISRNSKKYEKGTSLHVCGRVEWLVIDIRVCEGHHPIRLKTLQRNWIWVVHAIRVIKFCGEILKVHCVRVYSTSVSNFWNGFLHFNSFGFLNSCLLALFCNYHVANSANRIKNMKQIDYPSREH